MVLDTGIRFVMEGPQANRTRHKKRARLVTACDSCRVKKVKCHQPHPRSKCDSCKASNTPCQFGDRDRYHAERGMTLHNPTDEVDRTPDDQSAATVAWRSSNPFSRNSAAANSNADSKLRIGHRRLLSSDSSDSPSSTSSPGFSTSSSLPSTPPQTPPPLDVSSFLFTPNPSQGALPSSILSTESQNTTHFFDVKRPRYPKIEYMEHLAVLFFENLACHLPFLDRKSTLAKVKKGTLPAVLANSIAALSARYSDNSEILRDGPRHLAGEPFLQMAKLLVVPMMSWPSIEVLHSLVLIAWAEYGSARDSGLFMYSRMATAMLIELRLGDISCVRLAKTEEERTVLRSTWWAVARVDSIASWVTGCSPSLKTEQLDMVLASAKECVGSSCIGTQLDSYLTELFILRDHLAFLIGGHLFQDPQLLISHLSDIQARLAKFYRSLPASLAFNHQNLEAFRENGQGSVLLLLHFLLHGSNALAHWPTLFKDFGYTIPQNIEVAYASAKSLVDCLSIASSADPRSLLMDPFFDAPLSIAGKIFLDSRTAFASLPSPLYNEAWNESNLLTCIQALDRMSNYWGGATLVRQMLEDRNRVPSVVPTPPPAQVSFDYAPDYEPQLPVEQFTLPIDQFDLSLLELASSLDSSPETSPMLPSTPQTSGMEIPASMFSGIDALSFPSDSLFGDLFAPACYDVPSMSPPSELDPFAELLNNPPGLPDINFPFFDTGLGGFTFADLQ